MKNTHDVKAGATFDADLEFNTATRHGVAMGCVYKFELFDKHGSLKWTEEVPNLVVDEGLNDLLTNYLKGSGYTAAFYVGIIDNAGFSAIAAGDDAAGIVVPVNGWAESEAYSEGVRQTLTLGAIAAKSVDNSASKAAFSIYGTVVVKGAFVVTNSTKGGGSGVLYGAAAFAATRAAESGDTLNVTVTLTSAAS